MSNRIAQAELDLLIRERRFRELFIQLGWDLEGLPSSPLVLSLPQVEFTIDRVAEKRGFAVCICDAGARYPASKSERRQLVNQLSKHHYEHLLIICGHEKQCWTVAIRPQNRPMRTVEVEWHEQHDVQALVGKLSGIFFDISEEESTALTDVVDKVRSAFMQNAEKVTKSFYNKFQNELSAFSEFIEGIDARVTKEWYAALMLNRLMFIYFIQKKGFLDEDRNYLENRLEKTQKQFGKDAFNERFYRHFLRRLFSEGLGTPVKKRDPALRDLLGKVPYLNGGLFDVHEIEKENKDIKIPDEAFEKLFAFFGQYNWHLDTRPVASGKDINPDVIGYIFEKYINNRAEMGAYYTQEDITGYIARNTIIPFLLHRAKEKCKNAFDPQNSIWQSLRDNPDDYIYDAVKQGCDLADSEIPGNIKKGIDTKAPNLLERRKDWNTATEERFALPTEIWRETIARRQRYFALKQKIKSCEVCEIDDLITYNLDIERFASDALRHYEGSDFIAAFYETIAGRLSTKSNQRDKRGITVLDPACGSGAFLFAALNILEPLYERCIERMRDFVKEDDQLRKQGARKGTKKHLQFREVLTDIKKHQNEKYWIYKTIILNNLYGVDLMKEAAEIAKLRLFLKLAAEAKHDPRKDNLGLEPLPDIDFNIRAGNSLVGFASMAQFEQAVAIDPQTGQERMALDEGLIQEIREQAALVQKANERFRQAQDSGGDGYRQAKDELSVRLGKLNEEMNNYLAEQYGKQKKKDYRQWLASHQPFHWLTDFYGIIEEDGGFDVVIGNPPYVEYKKVKKVYTVKDYETESCGNLYAYFMERNVLISSSDSSVGQIVPVSVISTPQYYKLRNLYYKQGCNHISSYNIHPCCLFEGAHPRLSIILLTKRDQPSLSLSKYHKWYAHERGFLFERIQYLDIPKSMIDKNINEFISKLWNKNALNIARKIENKGKKMSDFMCKPISQLKNSPIFYRRTFGAFSLFYDFVPEMFDQHGNKMHPTELKQINFLDNYAGFPLAIYYSSSFYFYTYTISDCRNMNKKEVGNFCINLDQFSDKDGDKIFKLSKKISRKLISDSQMVTYSYKSGTRIFRAYYPRTSKDIFDKVDKILAKHYNFTEEELDYIINYDIKYRMGLGK